MDTSLNQGQPSTLRHYVQVALRHKWVIVQAFLVVTAAALAFSLTQEKLYEGTASVLLNRENVSDTLANRVSANDNPQLADRVAKTEADLARSPVVASRTVKALALTNETPQSFLGASSVEPKPNTDILEFKARDEDGALAKRLATEYAGQFVRYRNELDTAALRSARSSLESRIKAADPESELYGRLVAKDEELRTQEALQTSNATVVESADRADVVQPLTVRNTIVGAALGLLLGLGLAFLWDALDTRVRSSDEISDQLGLSLLARLPEPPRKLRDQNRVMMIEEPTNRQSELFRMLRTNLDFAALGHDVKTMLVTSATQGEGKSTTVANLGVALARAGRRVIIVDLDLRRPFMHNFFGTDTPGVTQVVLGSAGLDEALKPVELKHVSATRKSSNGSGSYTSGSLRVMTSGPIPPDPGEFLGTEAVTSLLQRLGEDADIVLVDAPPLLNLGDSLVLSSKVDALLLVARLRLIRRPMLKELARVLEQCPARRLGFVITGADADPGYGYGYGYGYEAVKGTTRLETGDIGHVDAPPAAPVEQANGTAAVEPVRNGAAGHGAPAEPAGTVATGAPPAARPVQPAAPPQSTGWLRRRRKPADGKGPANRS